ncbi:peptidyl-prolyl cis-trans isomerase F, mitochondrial isoform X2 [Leptinotarsa decemlineata]|uniref:peptidyl-prolyl cis-trans isomerase F, mitochondrial isoform X2 n=1 Tax=Leptinotarsa decemlineata TaxID=7539 RepID=UPI000C255268|nr:peptidyl-prolyl cis-trans isomerase F, mitochondrial-like isoform X2 [Leptinotarsa decemlineata]
MGKSAKKLKKVKQFRPQKQFRYLPGSVTDEANTIDLATYNSFRYRVFCARPMVDCYPSKLKSFNLLNIRKLSQDLQTAMLIDKKNKELLAKINMINRKGGVVDTYNPLAYRRTNKWMFHELKMKKIAEENLAIYKVIQSATSFYQTKEFRREWQTTVKEMDHSCKYPLTIVYKPNIDNILRSEPSISDGLQRGNFDRPCFLEFQVRKGEYLGVVFIELYFDHVPVTVQNFVGICTGEGLTYKNCLVHRIIKGQYLETGDITKGTGRGGASIYGERFHEENHMLKHTKAGVLSMKRLPPTDNNSQFCITFTKMEQLDHKNVVFGKVIQGNATLFKIQDYGRKIGKPYAEIYISNCGVLD